MEHKSFGSFGNRVTATRVFDRQCVSPFDLESGLCFFRRAYFGRFSRKKKVHNAIASGNAVARTFLRGTYAKSLR